MAALVIIRLSVMNGREADKLKEVQEGEGEVSATHTTDASKHEEKVKEGLCWLTVRNAQSRVCGGL